MSIVALHRMNIRQLQLCAAVCLWKYCNVRQISHGAIDELIRHLVSIATAECLPDWEQDGGGLEITGRGDPIGDHIMAVVPEEDRQLIFELIECCVEVGLVDMYGATTGQPASFAARCLAIIETRGIGYPDPDPILDLGGTGDEWGAAYRGEDVERALRAYGMASSSMA